MSATAIRSTAPRRPRDDRRIRRFAAAGVLVVPATCIAASGLVAPGYGASSTAALLDAIAAEPGRRAVADALGALALLTLVSAFLAVSRLARRRRPLLAAAAAAANLIAHLGLGLAFGAFDGFLSVAAARPAIEQPVLIAYLEAVTTSGLFGLSTGLFVFGHLIGAVLAGLALRGTVPTWTWIAPALSPPLHLISSTVLQNRILDAAARGLAALALIVCPITVLRTSDDEWDLPPLVRT